MIMNKKLIRLAFTAALVAIAGYGIYANQNTDSMSELMLANVEALADDTENPLCPNGCVAEGNGCTCNGVHYPEWREYSW